MIRKYTFLFKKKKGPNKRCNVIKFRYSNRVYLQNIEDPTIWIRILVEGNRHFYTYMTFYEIVWFKQTRRLWIYINRIQIAYNKADFLFILFSVLTVTYYKYKLKIWCNKKKIKKGQNHKRGLKMFSQ